MHWRATKGSVSMEVKRKTDDKRELRMEVEDGKKTRKNTVGEFDRVCKRRKLRVNAGKSKVMVFEREREQAIDFASRAELEQRVQ